MLHDESILIDPADRLAGVAVESADDRSASGASSGEGRSDLLSDWLSHTGGDSQSLLYDQLLNHRCDLSLQDSIAQPVGGHRSLLLSGLKHGEHRTLTTPSRSRMTMPEVNDTIFGFKLLHELGAGAFARVFLAHQGDLANREVVLKISAIEGAEPQTLAQLQHTHVVPIYSVHEDVRTGIRAVCMPYFGGAALSKVLQHVWLKGIPSTGREFIEALDRTAGPEPAVRARKPDAGSEITGNAAAEHSIRGKLSELSYVQTAVWTVCRLAEGLQHAHDRNVLHRDIKPSNILIGADGQPLLLDFNVSQLTDGTPEDATLGGTIAYMAPEHLRAVIERDAVAAANVDGRSDVYSLGLVLYEMLVGGSPFLQTATFSVQQLALEAMLCERSGNVPSLKRTCKFDIPWSLESIVRKCLAPQPEDRYRSPAQLAEDLSRFLHDLPLKFAPELSRVERIQKWVRRHPRWTTAGCALLIAAALILPGINLLQRTQHSLEETQNSLTDAQAFERAREFQTGTRGALCLVNTVLPNEEMQQQGVAACEKTLGLYKILEDEDWQTSTFWTRLPPSAREPLALDVRELLLVLAEARTRGRTDPSVYTDALRLLAKAEQIADLPKSRALVLDQARYLALLQRDVEAQELRAAAENIPASTAHDLYMLGSAHARQRTLVGYRDAVRMLSQAIEKSPGHYWSYFERALCYQEIGETLLATTDLGTCIGLWLESPWAYFNRGYLLDRQGRKLEAAADYSEAIRHSPKFSSAWFNRGLVRLELTQYASALTDFETVKSLGRNDALIGAGRAMALEGLGRHPEADQLFDSALTASRGSADGTLVQIQWTYGFAVAHRAPHLARRAFDEILKTHPTHPQAHYGLGMIWMRAGDLREAVKSFDSALETSKTFAEPLRYRAIALARLGDIQQAAADVNACLDRDPLNAESLYTASCVAALSSRKLRSAELRDQSLTLLRQAIICGAAPQRAVEDSDLAAIHNDPRFELLLKDLPKISPELK